MATISDTPINDFSNAAIWHIDNKYYEADVSINVLSIESLDVIHPPPTTAFQAVILVFDATSIADFSCVRTWKENCSNQDTVELTLTVALYPDGVGQQEEPPPPVQQAEQWCLDKMYELVPVNVKSFGVTRDILLKHDDEGVGRLLQALQAHMWPGMTRKHPQRKQAANDVSSLYVEDVKEPSLHRTDDTATDDDDDDDGLEALFTELTMFNEKMGDADHKARALAAGDMILRLQTLLDAEGSSDGD